MDNLYNYFISGLWNRYTVDHITLFFAVLIVAYTLSSYRRVVALCGIFSFFTLIGITAAHFGVNPSGKTSFVLSSLTVLIPAFFCIFGVTTKPSTATEKMGLLMCAVSGTVYGITSLGQTGGSAWFFSCVGFCFGLFIGVLILSFTTLIISRLLEYITLSHRDIALITSSVAIGLSADTVLHFIKDILS